MTEDRDTYTYIDQVLKAKSTSLCLIAGCSHAAGFEIDGCEDSAYNRANSFGSVLASILKLTPHNIALGAQSNSAIARSVIDYIENNSSVEFVCVGWTEMTRVSLPSGHDVDHLGSNATVDTYTKVNSKFLEINSGWPGFTPYEQSIMPYWHEFMVKQADVLDLITVKEIYMLQQYLVSKGIDYIFCNTMLPYRPTRYTKWYWELIDESKCMWDEEGFYFKYKSLGYSNPKAQYWHHDETPHRLYAEELYNSIATR